MSIHVIKEVLTLLPEVSGHVKKAHAEQEFPVDSKDSTISSALQIEYMMKVANQTVDPETIAHVHKAVRLYGVADEINNYAGTMVKRASEVHHVAETTEQQVREAESILESRMQGLFNMEKVASSAEALYDEYKDMITSPAVQLYAGAGMLNKEAAVARLKSRASTTNNREFLKVAHVIEGTAVDQLTTDDNRAIVSAITGLEKSAGLYDGTIYRDIFMVKEAQKNDAISVNLGSKTVTVTQLKAIGGDTIKGVLGADIAKVVSGPAVDVKHALEALPIAEKQALARLIR